MNGNTSSKYWLGVLRHFSLDVVAFALAFSVGISLRLPHYWTEALGLYWSGILVGAVVFACVAYVCGLYSLHSHNQNAFTRYTLLLLALILAIAPMLGLFYLNFSTRIGRGAMLISAGLAYLILLLHHAMLHRKFRSYRERVALIVTSDEDEQEARLLNEFGSHYLNLVGVIHYENYRPRGRLPVLGSVGELPEIVLRNNLERVVCTNKSIIDPNMCRCFCQLRYSGVGVVPIIGVFEEMCQCVPLPLITPEWLLSASGAPHMLYIKKLKRAFDIVASLAGLFCAWPFLLCGMLFVKICSPQAPVIFRQTRVGRFGQPFKVLKLRTMKPDAEKGNSPVWASREDPRAIPGGNFLRRYRIDEIPQLWNVLRGDMSFVGPRPERPEFVTLLTKEIPYFQERILVQPGITGWAQVNYPYGASIEDARRKLEYDLYYAKNMSLFLDVFILLDTIRIILRGGLSKFSSRKLPRYERPADFDTAIIPAPPRAPEAVH